MSVSFSASSKSTLVGGQQDSASATVCFWPRICQTSKSKSYIQAIQPVTKAPGRSVSDQFSWATKIFASVLRMNLTLYS